MRLSNGSGRLPPGWVQVRVPEAVIEGEHVPTWAGMDLHCLRCNLPVGPTRFAMAEVLLDAPLTGDVPAAVQCGGSRRQAPACGAHPVARYAPSTNCSSLPCS